MHSRQIFSLQLRRKHETMINNSCIDAPTGFEQTNFLILPSPLLVMLVVVLNETAILNQIIILQNTHKH